MERPRGRHSPALRSAPASADLTQQAIHNGRAVNRDGPPVPAFAPGWVLAISLLGISFAGPLVRLSRASALGIAVWRLGFSLVIVAGALLLSGEWRAVRAMSRRELAIAAGAGVLLAVHFWAWNVSVQLTTIAASVTLVSVQPVFVALLSAPFLREVPSRRQFLGMAVALAGVGIVAAPTLGGATAFVTSRALLGDLLALSAALAAALYFVAGRTLRVGLGLWAYVAVVYAACFATLLLIAATLRVSLAPQPPRELAIFAALALGPMLVGHTGMNWALRYLPAYVVNLVVLGEPVGATLLGALLPGIREIPPLSTLVGGAVVLAGVVAAVSRSAGRAAQPPVRRDELTAPE